MLNSDNPDPASVPLRPFSVTSPDAEAFNIAQYLPLRADESPDRPAVICPHAPDLRGRTRLTFAEMNAESGVYARGLARLGIRPGCRTLLMVRPGLDFVTLTFALFKAGAVPVLIDPGMGKSNLLNCIRQSRPEAVVAIPLVHAVRVFKRSAFSSVKVSVTVGRRWFWGGATLPELLRLGTSPQPFQPPPTTRGSSAAVLFTTGSTGMPKGVLYTHGMFDAQVRMIREHYGIQPGEADLPAFPLFALFSAALGTTCVIPDMDPSRPAQCDPAKIVQAIREHRVTYTFGSPAIWRRVGAHCEEHAVKLPSLKRILMAGAPVKGGVLEPFRKILAPDADTHIPYGATEALPLCSIRGSEVLGETWEQTRQGKGYCVGAPLPGVTVRIIDPDYSGPEWDEKRVRPQGEIGEIAAKSLSVTHEYFEMPEQTRAAKLSEGGAVWHRMGDMGYTDARGRIWFCGRKAHRVLAAGGKVHYSVCAEAVFECGIALAAGDKLKIKPRAALVGIGEPGAQRPLILIELPPETEPHFDYGKFVVWQFEHPIRREIPSVFFYPGPFPVDIRHNAKINREKLAAWVAEHVAEIERAQARLSAPL